MPIQVLPKHVADLIAAGEVVERPASVAKELCENALDAGATAVTVEIRGGGIRYLRVTDNGCGIAREDLRAAFLPHATSKIASAEDLESILTLGFRGEALASIAAVARVQVLTRAAGEELGLRYEIEAGEEAAFEEAGCPVGTTILVRDLFYKTPARMKFLRKDVTEGGFVGAAMERLALSKPGVAFTMIRDGKQVFQTPGDGSPGGAVRAVLGKAFYEDMLGVKNAHDGVEVTGFVCQPAAARPNRGQQYFFLNGRWIKCPTASAALGEAYKRSLMTGKFPSCVLYITLPTGLVDVNVHPAKTEVRFADDRPVFTAVYQAALQAISGGRIQEAGGRGTQAPQKGGEFWQHASAMGVANHGPAAILPQGECEPPRRPFALRDSAMEDIPIPSLLDEPGCLQAPVPLTPAPSPLPPGTPVPLPPVPSPLPPETPLPPAPSFLPPVQVVGEIFGTYFLAEREGELLLIDKHAAHERILYEGLKAQQGPPPRQVLLEPLPLRLSREEAAAVLESSDLLARAGFLVEEFGADAVVLRECPMLLTGEDLQAQLAEIAGYLLQCKGDIATEALDWVFHSAACRAAVKAGDPTTPYERERFVEKLLAMPEIRHCPHGRPVMAAITKKEIEKIFGR